MEKVGECHLSALFANVEAPLVLAIFVFLDFAPTVSPKPNHIPSFNSSDSMRNVGRRSLQPLCSPLIFATSSTLAEGADSSNQHNQASIDGVELEPLSTVQA